MKHWMVVAAVVPNLALVALAQDDNAQIRLKLEAERLVTQAQIMRVRTAVTGRTVKDAPYSATEITEMDQVLGDGTRIHNETRAQVYRDSEGRTRRESGDEVTIWDPVAKVSYVLNSKDQTVRQMPLGGGLFYVSRDGGPATLTVNMPPDDPSTKAAAVKMTDVARLKADKEIGETKAALAMDSGVAVGVAGGVPGPVAYKIATAAAPESLGTQNIQGVIAQGTRTTSTIPAGAIGNDRPIQTVNERWFSPDLQMVVQSRTSDPRSGEETFRLTNISRAEPPGYLFEVPAGYKTIGLKPLPPIK